MFLKKTFVLFTFILFSPIFAKTDTYSLNKNLYVGFNAGIISPNDIKIEKSEAGIINGVDISANVSGDFIFDNGYQIGGLLGYRFNDFLSFETELAYTNFDYDKLNLLSGGTATVGGITFTGSNSTSYIVDGNISAFSMIFGPVIDMDVREGIELFIGGAIGFSSYSDEIKSVGGSAGLSFDEDFTDFAAKFKTGINYSLNDQTYLQAEYGYNYVDSSIDNFSDDFSASSFSGKIVFNFW